jgi:uncharacterized protein (DUF427 family)
MKAIWNSKVVAEAYKDDMIYIEGNWYFPPSALTKEYFAPTDKHTVCFWKGLASYYQIDVDGSVNNDGAWYYPKPTALSKKMVKKDFTDYVAFWHGVDVTE